MKKFVFAFVFAALFAVESFGVDAVWKNTATEAQEWMTATNWEDASTGEELTEPPVAAGCTATFPDIDKTVRRVNLMGKAYADRFQAPVIDSITGGECWRLALPSGNNTWGRCSRSVKVGDVNGFKGEWYSDGAYQTLDLSNATTDQELQVVYPHYHFPIKVPAGIAAEMRYVRGSTGAIAKEGAGKLKIGTVMDAETLQLQLNEGEVELAGVISSEDEIIKKAYYHLDANLPDTVETYTDEEGRTRVTKWFDANGSGRYASIWDNSGDSTASHIKLVNAPFITEDASTTGLSVMDFGCSSSAPDQVAEFGPTNCTLRFSERLTNAREVLWVSGWNNGTTPVIGDDDDYTFVGGRTMIFTYGHTITNGGGAFWHNANYRAETPLPPDEKGFSRFATPSDDYTSAFEDLRLCDVKLGTPQRIHYLSTDRRYSSSVGGVKMGEMLIFTNVLTDAERQLAGDYLMKRWFAKRPQSEFRNVYAAAGTSIAVPAGRTARIDNLVARGTVTKKGAGTLVIGRTVQDPNLLVEEGDVLFETKTFDIPDDAPAGTPQVWYDGDQEDCFVTDENGVTAWKDRRAEYATVRQATRLVDQPDVTGYPQIDMTSCPGHTVLAFPAATAMSLPEKIGSRYTFPQETFIVFAFADETGAKDYNFLPNGCYTCVRGAYRFQDPDYVDDYLAGGVFTLDGVPEYAMEPATGARAFESDRWHVASAAALSTLKMDGLARDGGRNRVGHLKIGEVITYADALTEDQRRQTVAYLMKKWLGKDHPESQAPAVKPALTFDGEKPAVISTEAGLEVQSVAGGNGNLVKKGVGKATVSAELADTFTTLTVESGSLEVTTASTPRDRSAFHFDASKADSLTCRIVTEESGVETTNVIRWTDVRSNGMTARVHIVDTPERKKSSDAVAVTNPVLTHVETAAGKMMPLIDFGHLSVRAGGEVVMYNDSAAFRLYQGDSLKEFGNIVESHIVWCPAHGTQGSFFGATGFNVDYYRANSWIFSNTACSQVKNGSIEVNGVPKAYNTTVTSDVHLLSTIPTANTSVAYLCYQANHGGGCLIGEVLGFTETMTEKERTYVKAALMNKWLGGPAPAWTNEQLTAISIAAGSKLSAEGGVLSVPTIAGGGTIDAARVSGIETLNLCAGETLTVDGEASFADVVTVNLAGSAALRPGTYPIVTATSFVNLDLANWTLANVPAKYPWAFKRDGNSVVLEVRKIGLAIIVW